MPNVDTETKLVLQPIYDKLAEKYNSETLQQTENQLIANLQTSANKQQEYEIAINEKGAEIAKIEENLTSDVSKSEEKRLQSELQIANDERETTAQSLGEEKEKFYREIDKSIRSEISETETGNEYVSRYQNYVETLYNLKTSADEKVETNIATSEKSELSLLETILPNVDTETKLVLQPIYDKLTEKYNSETSQQTENQLIANLQTSANKQQEYEIAINEKGAEIAKIEENLTSDVSKSEEKRLQSELQIANDERETTAQSLGEEKEKFYREIDKSIRSEISETETGNEYVSRYQNYVETLYNLKTSADEKVETNIATSEKSELSLLETILPNVDTETKLVLQPIYDKLADKYNSETLELHDEKLSASINRQNAILQNIENCNKKIESLEERKSSVAKKSEQKRIANEILIEETRELDEIQKLAIEKSEFYSQIDKSLTMTLMEIPATEKNEYKNLYSVYNETLTTMKVGLAFLEKEEADEILQNVDRQEYELLNKIKPLVSGDTEIAVDRMLEKLETAHPELKKTTEENIVSEVEISEEENVVSEHEIPTEEIAETKSENVISDSIPQEKTLVENDISEVEIAEENVSQKTSLSGFTVDSYGIYEMPEIKMGLYYRIQIGAFNVRYRMRDFKGLSLIFTENIPNTNLIRYMTGEFYKYASAREDLPKVRNLGFSDAFIVAYYNGKRITIAEARRLEAVENSENNLEIPVVIRYDVPIDYVEPEEIIADNQENTNANTNLENDSKIAEVRETENQISVGMTEAEAQETGVYFAVQIGVYKERRSPARMKGISPIDYEEFDGFVRHTFGKFADYNQAKTAQNEIRNSGISDAFVIAYINGRKVSYTEGLVYQNSLRNTTLAEAKTENISPSQNAQIIQNSSDENLGNVDYEPVNLAKGTEENKKDGISYYVQIGAFSKTPDPEILSVFSKVAGDKIHVKFPQDGLQIYRIGVFDSYEEAQNTLMEARSYGIVDAFIVAFKGDEQISSSEAIRIQNAIKQIEQGGNEKLPETTSQSITSENANVQKPVVPAETMQQPSAGVEYFVQLGAFVHTPDSRSMATFRTIATNSNVSLQTVRNGRFTNYRVGGFAKFTDVKTAVDNARAMGVSDAFVVAFFNGERIPVAEAREKE